MRSLPNYQRRLAELGSRYIPRGEQIAGVDFSQLPNEVVPRFSEMMRERVEANLRRTDNLDPMIRATGRFWSTTITPMASSRILQGQAVYR